MYNMASQSGTQGQSNNYSASGLANMYQGLSNMGSGVSDWWNQTFPGSAQTGLSGYGTVNTAPANYYQSQAASTGAGIPWQTA
jgi:hypothetical protein